MLAEWRVRQIVLTSLSRPLINVYRIPIRNERQLASAGFVIYESRKSAGLQSTSLLAFSCRSSPTGPARLTQVAGPLWSIRQKFPSKQGMKLKISGGLVIPTLVAVTMASAVQFAFGMHMVLHGPTILFPNGYDTNRAEQVKSVLGLNSFKFLGGDAWDNDFDNSPGAILVYGGDSRSLTAFLAALNEIKGIRVRLAFSRDPSKQTDSALPAGSWRVEYSHAKPDTITVRVNLAAESLGRDKFEFILPKAKP